MAVNHLASPPCTPKEFAIAQKKLDKRKGYRKIRFKAWAPSSGDGGDEADRTASESQRSTTKSICVSGGTPSSQGHSSNAEIVRSIENIDSLYRCPSPLTKLPANGTRQDPFISLPIQATGCVPSTLDYFVRVVTPERSLDPIDASRLDHHLTLLLPFMLQCAPLFQSVIALCRSSILISLGRSPMEDKAVIYHRSKALAAVTESLSTDTCNSDATLLTITMLLTLEYLSGNQAGVSAHMTGLNKLTALRTDLNDSTPWRAFVKRGLDAYKSLGSFVTGLPPDIPKDSRGFINEAFTELTLDRPIAYPDLPFDPDLCTILARLPSGFSELCLSGHISIQSMHALASLTATTLYNKTDILDDAKLNSELQAILSALQRLSLMKITPMEKYLTCGLVAWCFQLRKLRPLNLFHDPPLRTFIKLIPTQEKPDSVREQKCLIWISMVIAGALNLRSIRMPGTHLVLERMFTLYPVSRDWEKLAPLLKSFYWTDKIGDHWKKCWDEAIRQWHILQARKSPESLFHPELTEAKSEEESPAMEEPDEDTVADIAAHMRAAPVSMIEAFQAAQCPFLQKVKQKGVGA